MGPKNSSVLIMANYRRDRAPGQRYRYEQYLGYLEDNGFTCTTSNLFSKQDERYLHNSGSIFRKAFLALRSFVKRLFESIFCGKYQIVFFYREALFWGPGIFEWLICKMSPRTILDFDDATWLYEGPRNSFSAILRNPKKTAAIVKNVDLVIVGNDYLADYCRRNGAIKVEVVPSTINTDIYIPNYPCKTRDDPVVIGWSGSHSTIKHFEILIPVLRAIKEKYREQVSFLLVGDPNYRNAELGIQGHAWKSETEVQDLYPIDIGIMPLPDNEWTRGKCGMKGLQYMALEIPAILSPVGANTKIIEDGENGLLANSHDAWVANLSRLIEDPELRVRLGKAGRKTVLEHYSVASQKLRYVQLFKDLVDA